MTTTAAPPKSGATNADIQAYWDLRIHDTELSSDPRGSPGFFAAMDAYRYGRLDYLAPLVDFARWQGRDVLDIGCGAGLDLVRFARAGACACGVELSRGPIALAREYLAVAGVDATLVQADAARLPFRDEAFDLVFCHGVLPFARDCARIVAETWRVLRYDGVAILMAYNRHSWMNALRAIAAIRLGHGDAPVFRMHTQRELDALLAPFADRTVVAERLPAPTRLHGGLKRALFDTLVVRGMRLLPERWIKPFGWHLIAHCRKRRSDVRGGSGERNDRRARA
jgi:SAM-dependent methyltransferase